MVMSQFLDPLMKEWRKLLKLKGQFMRIMDISIDVKITEEEQSLKPWCSHGHEVLATSFS